MTDDESPTKAQTDWTLTDALIDTVAAHRPYGIDCKCGRPINSDRDWAHHLAALAGQLRDNLLHEEVAAPTLTTYQTYIAALVASSERGICPVCHHLWCECECGVTVGSNYKPEWDR